MNEIERNDDALMAQARELPGDVQPGRDLWSGIEAAIADTPQESDSDRGMPWYAQAAAVLLLVGASSGLTWFALEGGQEAPQPVAATQPLEVQPAAFGEQYTLGPEFVDARATLASRLDEELSRLPDETRIEVEKNLEAIRAAINEINDALAEEPDNALLQELLISAYGEELAMMQKVNGISSTVMRRTDI